MLRRISPEVIALFPFGLLFLLFAAVIRRAATGPAGDFYFRSVAAGLAISLCFVVLGAVCVGISVLHVWYSHPRRSSRNRRVDKFLGRSLISLGVVCGIIAVVIIVAAAVWRVHDPESDNEAFVVALLSILGFGTAGKVAIKWGTALLRPTAAEILSDPASRPILFLRPFAQDLQVPSIFSVDARPLQRWSLEEIIATWLRPLAPVVAIGEPGERLPPPDIAARLYVSGDQWQQEVRQIARRSRLVVAVPAPSAGVVWEMRFVREHVEPERLLFALLARSVTEFEELRSLAQQELRTELPPLLKIIQDDRYWIPREQFYVFSADWKAELLPLHVTRADPKQKSTELGFSLANGSSFTVEVGKFLVRDYTAAFAPLVARLVANDPDIVRRLVEPVPQRTRAAWAMEAEAHLVRSGIPVELIRATLENTSNKPGEGLRQMDPQTSSGP